MSLDPEKIWQSLDVLSKQFGHLNKAVMQSVSRMERASTKVVAASSRSHGMMMGVVADLDLMTGAFGRMKRFLANIFLPLQKDASRSAKAFKSLTTYSGAWQYAIKPLGQTIKATAQSTLASVKNRLRESRVAKAQVGHLSRLNNVTGAYNAVLKRHYHPIEQIQNLYGEGVHGFNRFMNELWRGMKKPAELIGKVAPMTKKKEGPLPGLGALAKMPSGGINFGKMGTAFTKMGKGAKFIGRTGTGAFIKGAKFFNKEVAKPLGQIASGGIGLGFQTTIIMGLMQAFSSLFTIFQPIIEIVGMLMERLSVGFMPLIQMLMEILTSEPVLALIDMLSKALAKVFEMFMPLVPIIIELIQLALTPLSAILEAIMPIIAIIAKLFGTIMKALMPLIELLFGALAPVIEVLTKLFLLLIVVALYPLLYAVYGIGLVIAGLIDLFTFGFAGAINAWNNMMLPILSALDVATTEVVGAFQTGTDYVPETGVYLLHKGEAVLTPEENRRGSGDQIINVYIDGGVWVQDLDELTSMIGRKLRVIRG